MAGCPRLVRTMSKLISAVCVAGVLMAPVAALAHHSGAMFETKKTVTVTGTVKEFEYVNPHAWLYVVVTDDKGEETLWGFEAEGPSALMRAGIKNNALQPGDLDQRFQSSNHIMRPCRACTSRCERRDGH
jgi:hypothetical protein